MTSEAQWASMNERMICGTRGLRPRLENVPVKMPLPSAPADLGEPIHRRFAFL